MNCKHLSSKLKQKKTFEMFYFTCNESKIYESLYIYIELFHDILIYWDAPVCPKLQVYDQDLDLHIINY